MENNHLECDREQDQILVLNPYKWGGKGATDRGGDHDGGDDPEEKIAAPVHRHYGRNIATNAEKRGMRHGCHFP